MTEEPTEPPSSDDERVPKIGRGWGKFRFSQRDIFTIFSLLIALFAILAMQKGCAQGVGNLFRTFEPPPTKDGGGAPPRTITP